MAKRRVLRFLALVTLPLIVLAVVLYDIATETTRQNRIIRSYGGVALMEYAGPDWDWLTRLHLVDTNAFDEIIEIWLGSPPDAAAKHYAEVGFLRQTRNPRFSEQDMRALAPTLAAIPPADYFAISNCDVTDEGIAQLSALQGAKNIYLLELSITDDALKHLRNINNLKRLVIIGCDVSDEALDRFAEDTGIEVIAE